MSRSGRWRSEYIVDISEGKVEGKVLINVHYFEQGNVHKSIHEVILLLKIVHRFSFPLFLHLHSIFHQGRYLHKVPHLPPKSWL